MQAILTTEKNKLYMFAPAAFLLAGLMPEYVAPFFTVAGFAAVLKKRAAEKKKPRFGDMGICIIAYMAWMIAGTFYSSSIISSLASIGLWFLMFSGYYFFTETVDTAEKVDTILYCGSLTAGISGAIGIGQMLLYHIGNHFDSSISNAFNPFWRFLNLLIEKLVVFLPEFITSKMGSTTFHSFDTRACSTFSNPLFFATIEVMLLPFAAYMFLCAPTLKKRIIGFFCFMLSVGGIACSYSRGPYLFAVAVCAILLLYGGKKTLKLMGVGVAAGGIVMIFASGTVKRLFTLLSGKDISVNTRKAIWDGIFDMIGDKPILGYGTGFDNVRQMLHNVYNVKQPHAHNIFLEAWVENGILGVLLLIAVFLVFFINIVRLYRLKDKCREYAITLFASVAGFVLCGMTDCLFYGLKPLQYLMMVLGLSQAVFAIYLNKQTEKNNEHIINR